MLISVKNNKSKIENVACYHFAYRLRIRKYCPKKKKMSEKKENTCNHWVFDLEASQMTDLSHTDYCVF